MKDTDYWQWMLDNPEHFHWDRHPDGSMTARPFLEFVGDDDCSADNMCVHEPRECFL